MSYEIAVLGLGAFGSQVLWRLARRGVSVVGVEQFQVAHQLGSSHGLTRLFRVACLEHPGLVSMAQTSQRLWRELEADTGVDLLRNSGALMVGPETGRAIAGTRVAAERSGLPISELGVDEVRARYPQHANLPDYYRGLWDADAGVLRPEVAIESAVQQATRFGAEVRTGARVHGLEQHGTGVRITTATGVLRASQVIVTTGPWIERLVPQLMTTVWRVPLLWYRARTNEQAYALEQFPVFVRHYDDERTIWGHGAVLGAPTKVGLSPDSRHLQQVEPDTLDRSVHADTDWAYLGSVLADALPGLDPSPVKAAPCMITYTPDGQFVLGRTTSASRILVAGGGSGHGFKHATGIGESAARIALDEDPLTELDFLNPTRF